MNWPSGIGMDPLEFRRRNMVREGDDMLSTHPEPEEDVHYGSYGLDQCTRLVQDALDRGARAVPRSRAGPTRPGLGHRARAPRCP